MSPPDGGVPADRPGGGISRRSLLRRLGLGGVAILGTAAGGRALADDGYDATPTSIGGRSDPDGSHGSYGGGFDPPPSLAPDALDGVTTPPPMPAGHGTREVEIDVLERRIEVADGAFSDAWTFSGSVPGPTIRAVEGDLVRIRLRNLTGHPHNLHLHGRHHPAMDGWEPIPPGGETTYEIEAGPAGVHPYHCHVQPLAEHVGRGLFGMFIVDPPGGRPAAREVALVLGGFAVDGVRNAVVAWNGVAGFYDRHPIKVTAGEPVRCYVLNMLEYEPVASFHLHAQTFDVYPSGTGSRPAVHTDVFTMGQGERAILEFRLPDLGRYMFHPHQHDLASRGSMGWFAAV